MARRKKSSLSLGRIAALVALLVLAALGWWAWQQRAQWRTGAQPAQSGRVEPSAAQGMPQQLSGKLQVIKPPRDKELGIVVSDAVILLRNVEMYQWHEQCAGDTCRYALAWSDKRVDTRKFREPAGHENPAAPFTDARFVAQDVRLGDTGIDPGLIAAQEQSLEYPVKAAALPPNLAASFSVIDGALYAGGDPAHPQAGLLRIRYRIVPAGEVTVSGVRRGNRLEAK